MVFLSAVSAWSWGLCQIYNWLSMWWRVQFSLLTSLNMNRLDGIITSKGLSAWLHISRLPTYLVLVSHVRSGFQLFKKKWALNSSGLRFFSDWILNTVTWHFLLFLFFCILQCFFTVWFSNVQIHLLLSIHLLVWVSLYCVTLYWQRPATCHFADCVSTTTQPLPPKHSHASLDTARLSPELGVGEIMWVSRVLHVHPPVSH